MSETEHRYALDAPGSPVVVIDSDLVDGAVVASRSHPRKRVILPLHKTEQDALHRMINAVQPGSYIRPHRHLATGKSESIVLLRGSITFLVFEDDGRIAQRFELCARSASFGIDIEPDVYHTFYALERDTVLFEVKPGPFVASTDKDYAAWAPEESSTEVQAYLERLRGSHER